MLEIFKTQHYDYQNREANAFFTKALSYLQQYYPYEISLVEARTNKQLWVAGVISAAHEYGLEAERDVYSFLRASVIFGENFYELPWAKDIFEWRMDSDVKAALLDIEITQQLEKTFGKLKKENEQRAKKKIAQFCKRKVEYVYSFNHLYGLKLQDIAEAHRWVIEVCNKACEFGIVEAVHLECYLEAAMHFGKTFYERSWAKQILLSSKSVHDKVNDLHVFLVDNFGNVDA